MMAVIRRQPEVFRAIALSAMVFMFFAITQSGFATVSNIYTIVQGFMFLGLAGMAFGLTMIAGELDLAVPATATVAGVIALQHTDSVVMALLVAVAVGLVIGLTQGFIVWAVQLHSVVITLGTAAALIGVSMMLTDSKTVIAKSFDLSEQTQQKLFIFSPGSLIAIALVVAVGIALRRSRIGQEIRAIGGGRDEALAAGVPLWRPLIAVFVVSGVLSAILGVLVSLGVGSVSPTSFENLLLPAVAAALVGGVSLHGGRGSALGIAVGALTLRFVNSGMSLAGRPFFEISLAIAVLLLVVILAEFAAERQLYTRMLSLVRPS